MTTKLTPAVWNDAAALSVFILDRHGDRIASGQGWSNFGYSQFLDLCRRVAKLTGSDLDTVVNHIVAEARR